MKYLWQVGLLLGYSLTSQAAPYLVSDPIPIAMAQPTHCGVYVENKLPAEITVTAHPEGAYCKYDVSSLAAGRHLVRLTFIRKAEGTTTESAKSNLIVITREIRKTKTIWRFIFMVITRP